MPQDLLFEIGVEELPASFVARAIETMPELFAKQAAQLRLAHGAVRAMGTPRRLTLLVEAVAPSQPNVDEQVMGPPKSIALDADGKPTKAGDAFAKKLGKSGKDLVVVTTPKGEYVAVRREEKGQPARAVLPDALAKVAASIPFAKSMRWGAGDTSFGRPVQWLVALLGGEVLPVEFADLKARDVSRGHRFLAPRGVTVSKAAEYVAAMRTAHVIVDPDERMRVMRERLGAAATGAGALMEPDAGLEDECVSLVEEPHVIVGSFEEKYLELPEEVIVAVMRGHQRYFALRDPATGKLLPKYLTVVNTAKDPATIARGNDNVLRARLADAAFFVGEDRKVPLEERSKKLDGIVFQAKLGTVGEKVQRIRALACEIERLGIVDAPEAQLLQAATLAKADLVTLIVGELPELQGRMGRVYALLEGVAPPVADAIRDHYAPRGAGDDVPRAPIAIALALADRIDTLTGCVAIGLLPTGSADPFALRRAALGVIRIALENDGVDPDVRGLAAHAWTLLSQHGKKLAPQDETLGKLDELFRARLRAMYGERHRGDLVEACLAAWDGRSVHDLDARVHAVAELVVAADAEALAVAFKRAHHIAKDAAAGDVDPKLLTEDAERELFARFSELRATIDGHVDARRYADALRVVARELRTPIDRFFEKVFVMVDDAAVRQNRLRLLRAISDSVRGIAHFELLEERKPA